MKRNILFFLSLLVLSAAAAGCTQVPQSRAVAQDQPIPVVTASPNVVVEGQVVPKNSSWLVSVQPGKVTEVLVEEGDAVSSGDVIARLGDREQLEASLAAARLELLAAQQDLDRLTEKSGLAYSQAMTELASAELDYIAAQEALDEIDTRAFEADLDDEWTNVLDARDALRDAREEAEKFAGLSEDNPSRKNADDALEDAQRDYDEALRVYNRMKNQRDTARYAFALAEERLADARRESTARRGGPHPDDRALAQARLDNAQAQLAAVDAALANLELTAPYDGTIVELNLNAGEWVPAGQPLILLADFSSWYVETSDLTEMEVTLVENGGRVRVTPDALPEASFSGQVERISDVFTTLRGDITYTVRILLDNPSEKLRWGMTVQVEFE
jgi:HlyD family secretion protein